MITERGVKGGSHERLARLIRTWALDVHEVRVWRLYQTLELVAAGLSGSRGVEEVDGESL